MADYRAKEEILLWPRLGPDEGGRYYARQTPEPLGYAAVVLA